jgi:thioredoxin 1
MAIVTLTKENFEKEVTQSEKPVLVDFWASWCGPCRMMSPVVDEIAGEVDVDTAKIGKLNVDEEPELASKFKISSIPTLAVFKNGNIVGKAIGVRPKSAVLDLLKL